MMGPVGNVRRGLCYGCAILMILSGCVSVRVAVEEEKITGVDDVLMCDYTPPQEYSGTREDLALIEKQFGKPVTVSPGTPRANRLIWYWETGDRELRNPFLVMFGQDAQLEERQYLFQQPADDRPGITNGYECVVWRLKSCGVWHIVAMRNSSWDSNARDKHSELFRYTSCGWEGFPESSIIKRFGTPNRIATGTVDDTSAFTERGRHRISRFPIQKDTAVKELHYQNQCDELYFWLVEVEDIGWLVLEDMYIGLEAHLDNCYPSDPRPYHPSELPSPFMAARRGYLGCPVRQEERMLEMKRIREKDSFSAADDAITDTAIFRRSTAVTPVQDGKIPEAGFAAFPRGLAGLTNRIDTLRARDVVAALGPLPMTDRYFLWTPNLIGLDVPVMESPPWGQETAMRLYYPDIGLTFKRDSDDPDRILSVTQSKGKPKVDDSVALLGKIPLSFLGKPNPIIDFGRIRGDGGKLYLFTLFNDTGKAVRLKRAIPRSHDLRYDYGVSDLDPGESTYLGLVIRDWAPEMIKIPVSCVIDGKEIRLIVTFRRELSEWTISSEN